MEHPGGNKVIEAEFGKDMEEPFEEEGHSKRARGMIKTLPIVGYIQGSKTPEEVKELEEQALVTNKNIKETKVPKDFYTKLTKDFEYGEGKSKKTAPAFKCDWSAVRKKLVTKEDPIYMHKVFGLFALCSFAYRYFYCLPYYGNLGFEGRWFDHLTIFLHLCLSSSSLIFEVL